MDYDYLLASNGAGDAALLHVTNARLVGATTLKVDSVVNLPQKFIGTYGKIGANNFITAASKRDFKGHLSGTDIIIDGFLPGSTDNGNDAADVVIIKPNTHWTDTVATFVRRLKGLDTSAKEDATVGHVIADSITVGGKDVAQLLPAGFVAPFAGSAVPTGYLLCDGSAVSRTTYAELFAAIGTSHGAGNGTTTFQVPNLKGRTVFGRDASQSEFDGLGEAGGQKDLMAHSHLSPTPISSATGTGYEMSFTQYPAYDYGGGAPTSVSGTGVNNLNPYLVLNYIIKY